MNAVYKIVGADGRQYGPVSAGQIRQWIAEGRVESRTPVFTDSAKDWTFLGLLPEFAAVFPPHPPVIAPSGQPRRTNTLATAGLVCGIVSWVCCCGFPFNLLGLIFSLVALSQISRHPEIHEGRGIATAGLVLSLTNLLMGLGMVMWSLAAHPPAAHRWHIKGI